MNELRACEQCGRQTTAYICLGDGHRTLPIGKGSMNDKERLNRILQELDLPKGQYALAGSGVLVLHDIERPKQMGDVDIFLATRPWFALHGRGDWSVFTTDPNDARRRSDPPYLFKTLHGLEVNIFSEWRNRDVGNINVGQWIHSAVEVGPNKWPCVRLDFLLDWKRSVRRPKDIDDIRILTEALRA